uniref:Calponin-homology (CH) domain-containing protein n=1 Tax=Strigamia maritima TaxID=126957 RepID=T1J0P7_STRMM
MQEAISRTPDVSLAAFGFNEETQTAPTIYRMALNYLRDLAFKNATLLNEKMKILLKQLKDQLQETYENYAVWLHAYLIMYFWNEDDLDPLLEWVRSKAPGCSVNDFGPAWKNGLILIALLEGIVQSKCGCTQYHILNPKHSKQNVELAFSMAKKYLGVSPTLSAIEVTSGSILYERKLIRYITMLKLAISRRQNLTTTQISLSPHQDPLFHDQPCLVRGMGIITARRYKPARFNLYVKHRDQMDILIEINGPGDDFCSHRITTRSPRNQNICSTSLLTASPTDQMTDFVFRPYMNIDLEYEILGRSVSIVYWPVSAGEHELNIYWKGRHVHESPYMVMVEDAPESSSIKSKFLPHKRKNRLFVNDAKKENRKGGQVVKKRILRQFVLRNGKEIELEDKKPLPHDPKAWCGNTCLACKLVTDTPENDSQKKIFDSSYPQHRVHPVTTALLIYLYSIILPQYRLIFLLTKLQIN